MKTTKKTPCLKPRTATINVGLMIMFILFLTGFASAFEFDNVKSYNVETKTATITNAFDFPIISSKIADVQLKSEQHVQVGLGYQKVFEYEINSLKEYSNFIQDLEIYNLKKGFEKENKKIDLKYLAYEDVEVEDYKEVCKFNEISKNETCIQEVIGKHTETREVWKDLDSFDLKIGTKKISGWTEVNQEDYYEWIPNFAGIKVQEWATWTSGATTSYLIDGEDNYTVLTYLNNGTFNTTDAINVSVLVIGGGGGGGGGAGAGAGGGAGGFLYNSTYFVSAGNYSIIVGLGGGGGSSGGGAGSFGGSSSFGSMTSMGGGGGATQNTNAVNGGSSGGGGGGGGALAGTGGTGTVGQGNNGGNGILQAYGNSGGGGGAGAVGTNAASNSGGNGGNGIQNSINGTNIYYAGGGGGGFDSRGAYSRGLGGAGGGGNGGANSNVNGDNGVDGLGGGGGGSSGGSSGRAGGNGGSGVVIIRYKTYVDKNPTVTLNSPVNAYNSTIQTITFNCTATDDKKVQNITLYLNNSVNGTNTSVFNNTATTFARSLADGYYSWNCGACDNATTPQCANGTERYLSIDTVNPTILITSGNGTINYQEFSTNHTLNITFTDTNLDNCWINYNGTNQSFDCTSGVDSPVNFTLQYNLYNATIWANDTLGNENSSFVSWDYRVLGMYDSFTTPILEGVSSTFSINIITNGTPITIAWFNYNGTNEYGSITSHGDDNYTVSVTRTSPAVTTNTDFTFFWTLTQSVLGNVTIPSSNQTVQNLGIDNCSINGYVLYNFTMLDEELQTRINGTGSNTYSELNLQIYSKGTSNLITEFNSSYNQTNPFAVCMNETFNGATYDMDLQLNYKADGYQKEYYNLQKEALSNSTFTTFVNLYDLNSTDAQVFKIIFRNAAYRPVEDAIINIYRKYISENAYKLVEAPATDSKGEAVGNLVLDEVIYRFIVTQEGEELFRADSVNAICQNPTVYTCVIEFNVLSESVNIPDFEVDKDFNFTLGYNSTLRTILTNFSIPSGTPSTILLEVIKQDAVGSSICTDTLTSSSGTLSCIVPYAFENATVRATLYKDGNFVSYGSLNLQKDSMNSFYTGIIVFLSIFVFLTLLGLGISDNPIVTIVFLMVGAIVLFALNLVSNNGFLGATATILWFLIACVLLLIKGARR